MSLPLSVVIPTYNRAPVLARCLAALRAQSLDPGQDFEVVVVDDGSTDETPGVLEGAAGLAGPPLRYARQANRGPAAARNRGLALARGDRVLFLGDDAIAGSHLIRAHLAAQERRGALRAVVGSIVPEHAHRLSPFEQFLEQSGLQFNFSPVRRDPEHLPFAMFYTANVSAPRATLAAVGGFDERFRDACWEDTELGYRLARAGVRFCYAPEAQVAHAHPVTLRQYLRRMDKAGRAARLLVSLHPQAEVTSLVAPMLMSPLGYRVGRPRSLAARALVSVVESTGVARRRSRFLWGWYSIALHYAFNRAVHEAAPLYEETRP
jgi:GT2 family glycosyltransferase